MVGQIKRNTHGNKLYEIRFVQHHAQAHSDNSVNNPGYSHTAKLGQKKAAGISRKCISITSSNIFIKCHKRVELIAEERSTAPKQSVHIPNRIAVPAMMKAIIVSLAKRKSRFGYG